MQLGAPSTQIGRPKTQIKKDIGRVTSQPSQPETDTDRGSAKARPRRKTQADQVPMYKVILLGDEEYVEAHVVTQLQKTVQLEKKEATRIFWEAQGSGSSIVCVVCEEHAEFYAQQLKRQEIFVIIEKDE
ncbi:ATP-dependent Clp protease adaptor protein ClpS [Gracilaria domingensis]|nr:ATP-dependent Clp protease adaptor protein ClpS [Gracilaria domingensis]